MAKPGPVISLALLLGAAALTACAEPDAIGIGGADAIDPDEGGLAVAGAVQAEVDDPAGQGGAGQPGQQRPGGRDPRCVRGDGGIDLMHGFCASIVADDLGKARHLAVSPSGDLYVAIQDGVDPADPLTEGGLYALRDADDDGIAERTERIVRGGGNGVVWKGGRLYFAQNDRVLRFDTPDGQLTPTRQEPLVVVTGLPIGGDHVAKSIAVSDDGFLYVSVASATNACQTQNRLPGAVGQDPCPELERRGGIWRFDAERTDQTVMDGERYATGLRNGTAMTIHEPTNNLVVISQGRDELFQTWPNVFSELEGLVIPAEELFVVQQGDDYGWPYCYFDGIRGLKLLSPEYGGDGETVGRCQSAELPDAWFPAHWSPLAMTFPQGRGMPAGLRQGMFVSFHGSWQEPDPAGMLPGYQVAFVALERGRPTNLIQPFAWNFAGDRRPLPENARFRPVGLATAPDGSIYISDDQKGRIWRVFYYGS